MKHYSFFSNLPPLFISDQLQFTFICCYPLSKGKTSLKSLEEELYKLYKGTEHTEYEKEQQVKALQLEESQALANDNYDLAEEISNRMEQLKADLESSHYMLPAQDDKVNNNNNLCLPLAVFLALSIT